MNEVRWFLFFHFDIRDKRDEDVNTLQGMKWDAMISYRYRGTFYYYYWHVCLYFEFPSILFDLTHLFSFIVAKSLK